MCSVDIPPVYEPTSVCRCRYRQRYDYLTLRQIRYDTNTGYGHFGNFGKTTTPRPDTSVNSARLQYRYRTLPYVRYVVNIGTGHVGKFGTISIPVPPVMVQTVVPVPDAWVSSANWYRILWYLRYDIDTGTGCFGYFSTTSIPLPGIPVPHGTNPCCFFTNYQQLILGM